MWRRLHFYGQLTVYSPKASMHTGRTYTGPSYVDQAHRRLEPQDCEPEQSGGCCFGLMIA